jgi:hypothetical protein
MFYLDVVYVCNDFQLFLSVFQMHVSSVPLSYVANIVFECFKSRSGVVHGMRVENMRESERSPDGRRSSGAGGAATVKRRPAARTHAWARKTEWRNRLQPRAIQTSINAVDLLLLSLRKFDLS